MQANKASETTMSELKQWLEKPGTSAEAGLGLGIQQDLEWLDKSKDMSSITLGEKEQPLERTEESQTGGGGGGFMALFGCGGKRK